MRLAAFCSLAALFAAACGDQCVTPQPASCAPLYQPTFDNVYTMTLNKTCAQPGTDCHAVASPTNKMLVFENVDLAYMELMSRVKTGDPSCSLLVERLEKQPYMPPGDQPLPAAERCAIESWIRMGAAR
jgi:hypothetical protein